MATYRKVKGYSIKSVSSDPANAKEGQIWYNSSVKKIKVVPTIGAWASGGNSSTSKSNLGSFGIQTAAVQACGIIPPGAPSTDYSQISCEEYDGSSWTTGGNMGSVGYSIAGAGTQTAGLRFGGSISDPTTSSNISEEYDGSSWTSGETAPYSQRGAGGSGTQTAAIFHGGKPPTVATAVTYDGTNWAAVANLATARDDHGTTNAAAGGNNLAASFNGNISGGRATTLEEWTEAATTRTVDVS